MLTLNISCGSQFVLLTKSELIWLNCWLSMIFLSKLPKSYHERTVMPPILFGLGFFKTMKLLLSLQRDFAVRWPELIEIRRIRYDIYHSVELFSPWSLRERPLLNPRVFVNDKSFPFGKISKPARSYSYRIFGVWHFMNFKILYPMDRSVSFERGFTVSGRMLPDINRFFRFLNPQRRIGECFYKQRNLQASIFLSGFIGLESS